MRRAAVAVVAVVAIAAGGIWLARPKDGGPDPKAWETKASAAFKPLVADVPDLVRGAREWQTGERPADVFAAQVRTSMADFARSRDRVAALEPSPRNKIAGELYEDSTLLYVEVGRIYDVMLRSEPGDVRNQLDLLARRMRELADRVYDRGHAALAPYLDEQHPENLEVRLPEEVPIWPAEGLAAGPPLDDSPGPAATSPPLRELTRPEQRPALWTEAVGKAGIPPERAVDDTIGSGDRDRLRDLARQLVAAAERLRTEPDPKGQREKSAQLRLALLIDADGARSAQAATFVEGAPRQDLVAIGRQLARIGGRMLQRSKL
ncbi:MAG: hypothetical protein JWP02_362 [Acidimicrobiales bacterium]|nr:hypothetical protein [Acidimicrobiales bacterium]